MSDAIASPRALPRPRPRPRLLAAAALLAVATALAVFVVDRPLAAWLHAHGRAAVPAWLALTDGFDAVSGLALLDVSRYFAAIVFVVAGVAAALAPSPALRAQALPLWTVAIVHLACRLTINPLKTLFGRLRPLPWLEHGAHAETFFLGGPSFPSGHVGYYLSLCLPLALAFPRWRMAFLGVPVLIGAARVGAEQHFLGDTLAAAAWVTLVMWGFERVLRRVQPKATRA
jgi:membrane-associated phospholipid phosphatase